MKRDDLTPYLQGGDLRSIAKVEKLVPLIKNQSDFNVLFQHLNSKIRIVIMRTADAIEKITLKYPEFLQNHKNAIIDFLKSAEDKEFKWHLAQLAPRLKLTEKELEKVWAVLSNWAKNDKESKIVRANSVQALFDLARNHKGLEKDFHSIVLQMEKENVASINARIRKLK